MLLRLPARVRSQAGAELVEFALVLPMMLLVFGGIVDFGLLLQRQQVVTNAAREGARLGVLPGYTQTDVQARVTAFVREGLNDDTLTPATTMTRKATTSVANTPGFPAVGMISTRPKPASRASRAMYSAPSG